MGALSARLLRRGGDRLPTRQPLENEIRILDRGYMAVVILDHFDGSAHLLSQEIHVHSLGEAEGGVGMPEAVDAAATAG